MARFDHPEIRLFQSGDHGKADQDLVFNDNDNARRGYRADHGSNTVWNDSGSPRQIPVDRCCDLIGEPTLADAILDHIIHNAHRLQLSGDSLRKQRTPKTVAA
jgi:hypothetical protein